MAQNWKENLKQDPIPALLGIGSPILSCFTRRDLLDEDPGAPDQIWEDDKLQKILRNQNPDGSWSYPSRKKPNPNENYQLLETYRNLGYLVELYLMDQTQPAVNKAAEYILSHQTEEGDIRGIFGSQYAPHYTAGMVELMVKAGIDQDPRILRVFQWYENTRQVDGGWAWPLRTSKVKYEDAIKKDAPVLSDYSKPFSHALTGFVIRPFAAHNEYRNSQIAQQAGMLLKSRFFLPDKYVDRKSAEYWFKFQFPFWWGNLLTVLDSLSMLGFSSADPDITRGLNWLTDNQSANGFWPTGYGKGDRADQHQAWVSLAICRVLKRFSKE